MPSSYTRLINYVSLGVRAALQEVSQQNTTNYLNDIGSQAIFTNSGAYIPHLSSNKDLVYDTDTIIQNSIIEKSSNTLFRISKAGLIRIDITFTAFIHYTNTESTLTTKIITGNSVTGDQIDTPVTLAEYKKEIQVASDTDVRSPHAVETYNFTYYHYYDGATNDNNYIKTLVEGPDNPDSFLGAGFTITYTYLSKPV